MLGCRCSCSFLFLIFLLYVLVFPLFGSERGINCTFSVCRDNREEQEEETRGQGLLLPRAQRPA